MNGLSHLKTHEWRVRLTGVGADRLLVLPVHETEWGYLVECGRGLYWLSWPDYGPGVIDLTRPVPRVQRWEAA